MARIFTAKIILALGFNVAACGKPDGTPKRSPTPSVENALPEIPHHEKIPKSQTVNAPEIRLADVCREALPPATNRRSFRHTESRVVSALGPPNHRGRDLLLRAGETAWALGKFSYGANDKDLKDEEIDIYLLKGCAGSWKKLGTAMTTKDDQHVSVYGVPDSGGRVYFSLAEAGVDPLPVGLHKIAFVVAGDRSMTEQYIEVVAPEARIVVTDIDGTLTTAEFAAASEIVLGQKPPANAGAAELFQMLASHDFRIYYLTARPEWMTGDTRAWLRDLGFPIGTIQTTTSLTGAISTQAEQFKLRQLEMLQELTGITPEFAFGNKPSDVAAFGQAGIAPDHSYYFRLEGDPAGGLIHTDYQQIKSVIEAQL